MSRKGVLLINLGTPSHSTPYSVWRYLRQFLNDPRVIDLPFWIRWPLVNVFIVPLRFIKSSRAYQKIWTKDGSPLLSNSQSLTEALRQSLNPPYQVELGMRYGTPSIACALSKFKHCESLTVIPLFPQYASAATGSALAMLFAELSQHWNIPHLRIIKDFYRDPGFIQAYAAVIQNGLAHKKIDKLIFSYHGLPERHIAKSECAAICDKNSACPNIEDNNLYCYRAQCYATTKLLATELSLNSHQYTVSFQSRLGRTPWIKPYTDVLLPELIQQGIKNIAMVCPSFVADCLETLEEVNIRARAQWQALGGGEFTFIPCLNAHPRWVKALAEMVIAQCVCERADS